MDCGLKSECLVCYDCNFQHSIYNSTSFTFVNINADLQLSIDYICNMVR